MKKIFIILLSIFLLTGCTFIENDSMDNIEVYTTTYPSINLINYLYKDHATINSVYPNGVNFKEYVVSNKKLSEFAKSDLFVFNSQDIERDYAVRMLNANKNLKLIDTAYGMNYTYGIEELWLNPYNYLMMAKNVKNSLAEYITNPYLNEEINKNYEDLKYELSKLDATYQETLKDTKYKTIVTTKDFFKFLEKYNIEVISLEENIKTITITEKDNLSDISAKYNVSISDILTYNNKTTETLTVGEKIKLPIKTIDNMDLTKVKKLIEDEEIKYIYTDEEITNKTIKNLIDKNKLETITINTMYSIDGGITNNNENYLTVMNNNLELLKKELMK